MAITCYTDVGGGLSEIVLSPATLVSSAKKWVEFDKEWNRCLTAFNVTALHMKDFGPHGRFFVTVQVVEGVLRSDGTTCALRCDRIALPR